MNDFKRGMIYGLMFSLIFWTVFCLALTLLTLVIR